MRPIKNFLKKLSTGQKNTLLVALLGGCCVVVAALIGLGVPIIGFFLDRVTTQSALATPTFISPTTAVELPASQLDVLSVVINPSYANNPYEGIITQDLDPSKTPEITITKKDVVFVSDISPKISFVGNDSILIFEVYLTGKTTDEEVQVTNRIPIKVSYEPFSDRASLYTHGNPGGGVFYSVLSANVSSKTQQVWAEYSSDFRDQFQYFEQVCPGCIDISKYPTEIQKYLTSNDKNLPDYYLLKKNEKIGIPVVVFFQESGIYHLQIGAEYIYRQYKDIAWTQPEVQVYVPKNYYIWDCDNPDWDANIRSCAIQPACIVRSDGTTDCSEFVNP